MKSICLTLSVLILLLAGCASQDDVLILDERLAVLEQRNRELKRLNQASESRRAQLEQQLSRLGKDRESVEKNLRTQYASMNVNLDTVQEQLQAVNGRIDEIDFAQKRQLSEAGKRAELQGQRIDQLTVQIKAIESRLVQVEQYLSMDRKAASGSAAKGASSGQQSVKQVYANGRKAYDAGDMDKARAEFEKLIRLYPKSETADNAQFWIGESYYREKWYEKAILEYQNVIEKYPKGNKVPAALLKQGMAFLKLGDKSNARLILKELQKKYPKSNEGRIAAKKLKEF